MRTGITRRGPGTDERVRYFTWYCMCELVRVGGEGARGRGTWTRGDYMRACAVRLGLWELCLRSERCSLKLKLAACAVFAGVVHRSTTAHSSYYMEAQGQLMKEGAG